MPARTSSPHGTCRPSLRLDCVGRKRICDRGRPTIGARGADPVRYAHSLASLAPTGSSPPPRSACPLRPSACAAFGLAAPTRQVFVQAGRVETASGRPAGSLTLGSRFPDQYRRTPATPARPSALPFVVGSKAAQTNKTPRPTSGRRRKSENSAVLALSAQGNHYIGSPFTPPVIASTDAVSRTHRASEMT